MKAKHTPEPWFAPSRRNPSEVTAYRTFQDGAQHPVVIAVVTKHGTDEERQANARLIASAPELLAALEEAAKVIEVIPLLVKDGKAPRAVSALKQVLAAIEKAKKV